MLERFERIYLWMDDDGPGREGAEQFAKKIGVERCWIVRPYVTEVTEGGGGGITPKDANEALLMVRLPPQPWLWNTIGTGSLAVAPAGWNSE